MSPNTQKENIYSSAETLSQCTNQRTIVSGTFYMPLLTTHTYTHLRMHASIYFVYFYVHSIYGSSVYKSVVKHKIYHTDPFISAAFQIQIV